MGYNLWIDTANLPYNENDWKKAAMDALSIGECRLALYFRSENSMIKDTIRSELENIRDIEQIKATIAVDIWEDENNSAAAYRKKILNIKNSEQRDILDKICEVVKTGCNAVRFAADYGSDIEEVSKALAIRLDQYGIYRDKSRSNPVNNAQKGKKRERN